jgi:hypothetical protein
MLAEEAEADNPVAAEMAGAADTAAVITASSYSLSCRYTDGDESAEKVD